MDREFEVELIHRQRAIYRIRAQDREAAERMAVERWREDVPSEVPGYDWCELESVHAESAPDPGRPREDAEVVLRFLRERERLIQRLGGDLYNPSANDAISAAQVASDLGWIRVRLNPTSEPDVVRATQALEWLCRAGQVICFQRPRTRAGERGEIRLYCTPEYLEALAAEAEGERRQVV